MVVAQAYENDRMFMQEPGIKQKRFQYHETQMQVIELRKTMRTSVSIHNFLSDAVSIISETSTEFLHPIISKSKVVLQKATSQENTLLHVKRLLKDQQKKPPTAVHMMIVI